MDDKDLPTKKSKTFDFSLCVICQAIKPKLKLSTPSVESYSKLFEKIELRQANGDSTYKDVIQNLKTVTHHQLTNEFGGKWHMQCYKDATNQTKIDRLLKRFQSLKDTSNVTAFINVKSGRPAKLSSPDQSCQSSCTRPKRENFDKYMCVLCQNYLEGEDLHKVSSKEVTERLKRIGEQINDEKIRCPLSCLLFTKDEFAGVTFDMKYHLKCLMKCERESNVSEKDANSSKKDEKLCDFELLDWLSRTMNEGSIESVSMNDVQNIYFEILDDNSIDIKPGKRYKPYLKELIQRNMTNITFTKPTDVTKPELLVTNGSVRRVISEYIKDDSNEDFTILIKAANILRNEISNTNTWTFNGSFDDYSDPKLLLWFCNYLLHGPRKIKSEQKKENSLKSASIISQHIIQSFRTDRQVLHNSQKFRTIRETPLAVGCSIFSRIHFRSKLLTEFLSDINIGISYNKVMEIEESVAEYVSECMQQYGYYKPITESKDDNFHWYALDNVDFLEDTCNGMNTTHATGIIQISRDEANIPSPNLIRKPQKEQIKKYHSLKIQNFKLNDPKPKKILPVIVSNKNLELDMKDFSWILGCLNLDQVRDKGIPGTWGAFNSLISTKVPHKTNVVMIAPLIQQPPTDINVLYSSLMYIKNISDKVNKKDMRVVVTLDMQLYDLAMKLWCDVDDLCNKFLFRPGELHIIFWALASIGDYIEGSGLDQAWVEAGLYSATIVNNQILKGKHLYRCLECHFVTLISIYTLFFRKHFFQYPDDQEIVEALIERLRDAYHNDSRSEFESKDELSKVINCDSAFFEKIIGLSDRIKSGRSEMNPVQTFLLNYAKQFETLLLFIRATRDRNIELHLESLENLIKYFFAHDHLNYARLLPLYLATMQQTKRLNPELWKEFERGNFCVSKSNTCFTSIGPDHAIEQENRRLKVSGGIVGITQQERALQRFFLATPVLSSLSKQFESNFLLKQKSLSKHHDLTGSKPKRMKSSIQSLCNVIDEHGDPFKSQDLKLFNILTHALVKEKTANDIIDRDKIGQKLFEEFALRLDGDLSVWDHMKKRKIGSFKNNNRSVNFTNKDGKIITSKEERNLLQRFIVVARSRSEIDIEECIGNYEFGVVPRALFASDGSLILEKQKSKLAACLKSNIISDQNISSTLNCEKVIILDGMALVNSLPKDKNPPFQIKTCKDLANLFISQLKTKCTGYDEVRLVFDRYIESSLKYLTRKKRQESKISTQYRINDSFIIKDIKLKELLADIDTKSDLTKYFAEKCLQYSKTKDSSFGKFIVTYDTTTRGNINIPDILIHHDHEEADTLIILHASLVDRTAHLDICASDTDILVQLLNRHQNIPEKTFFLGKSQSICIKDVTNRLGSKKCSAIVGFHVFTGCDMTGKFSGKSKETCFKKFQESNDQVLDALSALGEGNELPSENTLNNLESYVCMIYNAKKTDKITELRWNMYSRNQAEGENLPPTKGALLEHIKRSHFVSLIYKKKLVSIQSLPRPEDYGWTFNENLGIYEPVMTLSLPAPAAIMELVKCNCKKGCSKRCSCRKVSLNCTEICGCSDFECTNSSIVLNNSKNIIQDDDN